MTKEEIENALSLLNEKLSEKGVKGEILLCGGTAMCLAFNARDATKDVDGIFEPTYEIRQGALSVARELNLPNDWLNDGAKAYFSSKIQKNKIKTWSHLSLWSPSPDYLLAMKCISVSVLK